jgi:hypothetical protein
MGFNWKGRSSEMRDFNLREASHKFWDWRQTFDKKQVLVQNKSNLLLKIILYNMWTLQLFTINIFN